MSRAAGILVSLLFPVAVVAQPVCLPGLALSAYEPACFANGAIPRPVTEIFLGYQKLPIEHGPKIHLKSEDAPALGDGRTTRSP